MQIRPLSKSDFSSVKTFTDMAIGEGYYSMQELEKIYDQSMHGNTMCTLIAEFKDSKGDEKIGGIRITYPPGNWSHGKGQGLNPEKWPHTLPQTAYFQSLFVSPELTGQGLGKKMSYEAIRILKTIDTKGIVCHSWRESPQDSSGRYLRALGFQLIAEHPLYWSKVDYTCTRCGKPCVCTADEMYLDLTV